MASVAPEVVVEGTVAAAPQGGTGHPALLALPPGVEYVRAPGPPDKPRGPFEAPTSALVTAPLEATDAVVDVFALDRGLFDAANASKRRVHFCVGEPGTLDAENTKCLEWTPTLIPPWLLVLCPLVWPQIRNLFKPHEDMAWPPWAAHALIVTEKGVVGRRRMRPDRDRGAWKHHERDVNAISWDGFDVDKVEVRVYAEGQRCYRSKKRRGICTYPAYPDPLLYAFGFGFLCPVACCWCVALQPSTPGLYHARIASDHSTDVERDEDVFVAIPTAEIDLIALARSPEDVVESLRRAKSKYAAPAAAAMAR